MMSNLKRKTAFTLIELIVAMALITLVIGISSNMIIFSMNAHRITVDEYDVQASMRLASEQTNQILRFSSALFTIPTGRFFEANLTEGWSYFGVSDNKREIVRYVYESRINTAGNPELKHWKDVIVTAQDNLTYDFVFERDSSSTNDKLIKFKIVGTIQGSTEKKVVIESEVEAQNALQVVDRGTALAPAVAIAYRADARPTDTIVGSITMVLDVSGSMKYALNGEDDDVAEADQRITKLKGALKGYTKPNGDVVEGMINEFAKEENIEIAIVPFSTSANTPDPLNGSSNSTHPFYKVSDAIEKTQLIDKVNALTANGGTNTGDGMRRAYYRNMYFRDNIGTMSDYGAYYSTSDYMIILVDGVTTFATSLGGSGDSMYKVDDGYQSNLTTHRNEYEWNQAGIIGYGNAEDPITDRYVELIGALINNANIKVYVIGFSSLTAELNSVSKIATAAGAASTNVYKFSDNLDLDSVFSEIKADIMKDLWHIRGPQM